MIAGKPVCFTFEKRNWCRLAQRALAHALYGRDAICAEQVRSGRRELFLVNGDSWLVTEIMHGNKLFIWAYAGQRLVQMVTHMRTVARSNGLQYIGFFTHHESALRALRRFRPLAFPTSVEGEYEYVICCAESRKADLRAA